MYSRKSVGPRMKPWLTPALTRYSCEDFLSRTTLSRLLLRKEEIRPNIWPERLKFVRKTNMPNPIKSLEYMNHYSLNSPRPVISPGNYIRHNCQKICCWSIRPKTILEIKKRPYFPRWSTILLFTSFSKTLLTTEKRLTG